MKKFIEFNKLAKRLWIILWLCFIILLGMKFLFNKWYPIIMEKSSFSTICTFVDTNTLFKDTILFMLYIFSVNVWYLTVSLQSKYKSIKQLMILNSLYVVGFTIKIYSNIFGFTFELLYLLILPTIHNYKRYRKSIQHCVHPLFYYIIINLWQMTSLLLRIGDESIVLSDLPTFIVLVMQLDYYVLLILSWIGVNYMGLASGGWFWGKSITQLQALKEKELKKDKPDQELIKQIDEAISRKQEKENE